MNPEKQKGLAITAGWFQVCRRYLFFACLGVWVVRWLLLIIGLVRVEGDYFFWAARSSPDSLRALYASYDRSSSDFYRILKICDRMLPPGAELQLVLPTKQQNKFEFLSGKARYLLYPRNYGDNATRKDYILVYQVKDFHVPAGYEFLAMFAFDKYLLINRSQEKDPAG